MEEHGISFEGMSRRKRSHRFRRPRPDTETTNEGRDVSSLSSTPPQDDESKASIDENTRFGTRKEVNINQLVSRIPPSSQPESERPSKRSRKEDVRLDEIYANNEYRDHKRSSEGVLAPPNWKSSSEAVPAPSEPGRHGVGNENKVKKVTLKVGGVTRTIGTNSAGKAPLSSEASVSRQKLGAKVGSEDDRSCGDERWGLQGIPWKDFSTGGFSLWNESSTTLPISDKNHSVKHGDKSDPVRKSKRAAKRRSSFDEEEEDDEIRYLEKLKNIKHNSGHKDDEDESTRKHRRLSTVSGILGETTGGYTTPKPVKEGKRKSLSNGNGGEGLVSDGDVEGGGVKREMTLTTRQRALQSGKDPSASGGHIEFPNGLPPALSRKKKEKLTEDEQLMKKAEAAKRRKLQNEKAQREIQEEAIRKILGQDSSRQKREEKKKKRLEELEQEKAAEALKRQSNCVKVVMGPNGTTVTFPNELGLPNIFNSKPNGYPPPREKCVGPSCTNAYKYRDSKTNLPLCSLQCYKRVEANVEANAAPDVPIH